MLHACLKSLGGAPYIEESVGNIHRYRLGIHTYTEMGRQGGHTVVNPYAWHPCKVEVHSTSVSYIPMHCHTEAHITWHFLVICYYVYTCTYSIKCFSIQCNYSPVMGFISHTKLISLHLKPMKVETLHSMEK